MASKGVPRFTQDANLSLHGKQTGNQHIFSFVGNAEITNPRHETVYFISRPPLNYRELVCAFWSERKGLEDDGDRVGGWRRANRCKRHPRYDNVNLSSAIPPRRPRPRRPPPSTGFKYNRIGSWRTLISVSGYSFAIPFVSPRGSLKEAAWSLRNPKLPLNASFSSLLSHFLAS